MTTNTTTPLPPGEGQGARETRAPGWYFLYWHPGKMQDTQAHAGPFEDQLDAWAEMKRLRKDGYLCGLPMRVRPLSPSPSSPPLKGGDGVGVEGDGSDGD